MIRNGLVLEGGALRGLFTCGVLDVLMEQGVTAFSGMIGVSAGAAFGCNMKSRQPGRVLRYNKRFAHDWRYCSLRSLLTTGDLFGAFCYHELPNNLDVFDADTFAANPMEFWLVCTDVRTGQAVYKQLSHIDYEAEEWFRASASMPLVSRPVPIGDRLLLDGGMTDSIPLERFERMGYGRNVVVLTQPQGFVKQPNRAVPIMRLLLRRYPVVARAMACRHEMYNRQLSYVAQAESEGRALVIRPKSKLPIGHVCHDEQVMQHTYDLGREMGQERLNDIKNFLKL